MATSELDEVRDLRERALKLSPDARGRLALELWESVNSGPPNSDEDRAYWKTEIARRIEAVENGTMKTYTLEETLEHIQKVLDEDRPS